MYRRDVHEYYWIHSVRTLSYRIIIIIRCIVLHTMCERYLLLYRRVSVPTMLCRVVLECDWIGVMRTLSCRIIIVIRCIVVHTLSYRIIIVARCIVLHTL